MCRKKILLRIYDDKHYTGGHYFKHITIPVGRGKYKKIGTSRLFSKDISIVKWTGKEKKVEYWECNKCYEEGMHEDWFERTVQKLYGKRCHDFEVGCGCCQAWTIYDTIISENRERL